MVKVGAASSGPCKLYWEGYTLKPPNLNVVCKVVAQQVCCKSVGYLVGFSLFKRPVFNHLKRHKAHGQWDLVEEEHVYKHTVNTTYQPQVTNNFPTSKPSLNLLLKP